MLTWDKKTIGMVSLLGPKELYGDSVVTKSEILKYLSPLKEIGVDLETKPISGDNITAYNKWGYCPYTTKTVMLQIGDKHRQFVIDTRYEDISFLKSILESKKVTKVGTNLKYDYQRLLRLGIRMNKLYDCMVSEMVIHCGRETQKGFYSLAGMATRYLNAYFHKNQLSLFEGADFSKGTRSEFLSHPDTQPFTLSQIHYGANDVKIPLMIKEKQADIIKKLKLSQVVKLENNYVPVIAEMEYNGMPINSEDWLNLEAENKRKLDDLQAKLNSYLDSPINWNSPKQVGEVFKSRGIKAVMPDKKSGGYKESVSKLAIAKKAKDHSIIADYLAYKEAAKLVSSYGKKFLKNINPFTGRIHSDYWQVLVTGRISSNSPNLQNVPGTKQFRQCFSTKEAMVLISADYSSQESRVLADLSQEKSMVKFFKENPDPDIHSFVATKMFGRLVTKQDIELRQMGKKTNFTIAYGGGAHKLADEFSIPLKQARELIEFYFKAFPKLKQYFSKKYLESLNQNYILIDKVTGRKSFVFDDKLLNYMEFSKRWLLLGWRDVPKFITSYINKRLADIQRLSQNYPIQGLSGSMTKLAGIYFRDEIIKKELTHKVKIVNTVHDEIIIECPISIAKDISQIIKHSMIKASNKLLTRVPMEVGIGIHQHWAH